MINIWAYFDQLYIYIHQMIMIYDHDLQRLWSTVRICNHIKARLRSSSLYIHLLIFMDSLLIWNTLRTLVQLILKQRRKIQLTRYTCSPLSRSCTPFIESVGVTFNYLMIENVCQRSQNLLPCIIFVHLVSNLYYMSLISGKKKENRKGGRWEREREGESWGPYNDI